MIHHDRENFNELTGKYGAVIHIVKDGNTYLCYARISHERSRFERILANALVAKNATQSAVVSEWIATVAEYARFLELPELEIVTTAHYRFTPEAQKRFDWAASGLSIRVDVAESEIGGELRHVEEVLRKTPKVKLQELFEKARNQAKDKYYWKYPTQKKR